MTWPKQTPCRTNKVAAQGPLWARERMVFRAGLSSLGRPTATEEFYEVLDLAERHLGLFDHDTLEWRSTYWTGMVQQGTYNVNAFLAYLHTIRLEFGPKHPSVKHLYNLARGAGHEVR